MTIESRLVDYQHGSLHLQGEFFVDVSSSEPKPVVLVAPTWAGRTSFEGEQAKMLAELGYAALAIDMYGAGVTGSTVEECSALMTPVVSDRGLLQARMAAALEAARAQPEAGSTAGAIGFCFGGLCVLDLARMGADVSAVVSFHGILAAPDNLDRSDISASILVLHGYEDPMADPDALRGFYDEMRAADCDWQVLAFGQTQHAFTNPDANNADMGTVFHPRSSERAFAAMRSFLAETLS